MAYARNGGTVIAAEVRADAAEETATIIRDEGGPSSEARIAHDDADAPSHWLSA